MSHAHHEKWGKTNSGRNSSTEPESIRTLGEKENYKYLEAQTFKSAEMKKKKKPVPKKNEKAFWSQILYQKFLHWRSFPFKILGTILHINREERRHWTK